MTNLNGESYRKLVLVQFKMPENSQVETSGRWLEISVESLETQIWKSSARDGS